jgi:hypothetical protein
LIRTRFTWVLVFPAAVRSRQARVHLLDDFPAFRASVLKVGADEARIDEFAQPLGAVLSETVNPAARRARIQRSQRP